MYVGRWGWYDLTVYYLCDAPRDLCVTVNSQEYLLGGLASGGADKVASRTVRVKLRRRNNVVRLANHASPAPDIDKIVLERKG